MKPMHLRKAIIATALSLMAHATFAGPILIDYGDGAAAPTLGGTWNTIDVALSGSTLLDSAGVNSGVTITLNQDPGWALDGTLDQGAWPAGNVSWVDGAATSDYIFTFTSGALVTFSGLVAGDLYRFDHVAARSIDQANGAIRRADYRVNGVFADSAPNGDNFESLADGWTAGNILSWSSVAADVNGEIQLSVTEVRNFGYANASRLERVSAVPVPATLALFGLGLAGLGFSSRKRA